jgi:hypothetical protein
MGSIAFRNIHIYRKHMRYVTVYNDQFNKLHASTNLRPSIQSIDIEKSIIKYMASVHRIRKVYITRQKNVKSDIEAMDDAKYKAEEALKSLDTLLLDYTKRIRMVRPIDRRNGAEQGE